jgi:ATP-binding cassette subfamily B protein
VIDAVATSGVDANLWLYGGLYAFFTVLLGCSVSAFIWYGGTIRTHVAHDIRMDGFNNLQKLSFSYYDFRPVGWLMARMTSDCERLSNILAWGMLDLIWGCTMMLGIAIAMLFMNFTLGLMVLSILPVLAWISINFQHRILRSARIVRKTNSRITGSYNESIMGVQTSKAFVKEAENLKNFGGLTDQMHGASVTNLVQAALYLPIVLTLGSVATGLALVFGGLEVVWGAITAGTLVAFLAYTRHFFEPIEQLAHWFAEMQMAQASAERIMSLVLAESDIQDSEQVLTAMRSDKKANAAIDGHPDDIREVTFEDVSFRYDVGDPVLKHVNLKIAQGETLAIVGSTGGGKSTLVSLLCRFYEPTDGRILIDGIDYRQRSLHWLQSNLGIVLQSSHIFGGTIMENIRYGKLDANDAQVLDASKRAGAHEFVEAMDDGYNTQVGEGGSKLSAGQKQLVSFARAILADPKILIMDEATSSVDTETEQQIQHGLDELLSGRIALVIAHRLSTIRNADRILVIEHGEITEQGSHDQLMSQHGRYYKLYTQQSLSEFANEETNWQA